LAWIGVAALLTACSYDTSSFAVLDGSVGKDTTVDDSNVDDSSVDDSGDTTLDDSGDSTIDETLDSGGDGRIDTKDTADAVDTTPLDAATCTQADALVCGSPPACAVTKDDPLHCATGGGCGIACDASQYCLNGSCTCRPGLVACGGACVDTAGDETHCGGCPGALCTGGNHCGTGACVGGSCPTGRIKCGRSCWDPQGDPTHCGTSCTDIKACNADQLCIGGACVAYLPAFGCSSVAGCDCTAILGSGARACPGLTGSTDGVPICVDSTFCPAAPWN
jgi:hypothetical protein